MTRLIKIGGQQKIYYIEKQALKLFAPLKLVLKFVFEDPKKIWINVNIVSNVTHASKEGEQKIDHAGNLLYLARK